MRVLIIDDNRAIHRVIKSIVADLAERSTTVPRARTR